MKDILIIVLLFYLYSFIGWVSEVITTIIKEHKFVNRGFLIGPLCPIYGACCVLMNLCLRNFTDRPILLFLLCMILCATLEYITSYIMEKIFKTRWWDYYEYKFNLNGRICLLFTLLFGIGGLAMFYIVNPVVFNIIGNISTNTLHLIIASLASITLIDLIVSFNIIYSIKNITLSLTGDSTEIITKKVKEILFNKTPLHKRIWESFPDMKPFNKMVELKNKLKKDKNKVKEDKKKIKEHKKNRNK